MFSAMHASERAQQNGFKPGTSAYNEEVKRILVPTQPRKTESHSPPSPLSPVSLSSSSCIGRLHSLERRPELNGRYAIIVDILSDGRTNVIPITLNTQIRVPLDKITNVSMADIQVGGRKRKSRKNRYTKNSRRTRRSRRTRHSKRTKQSKRNK
jgi:hypothetical protein